MLRTIKFIVLGLSVITLIPTKSKGQAWTREKGDLFLYAGISHIAADKKYDIDEIEVEMNRTLTDQTFNIYGEYGITDNLTLTWQLPIKRVATSEDVNPKGSYLTSLPAGSLIGLSNIYASFIYKLSKPDKSYSLSLQTKGYLPTVSQDFSTGLQTGYNAWGAEGNLHFGLGMSKGFWLTSSIGINARSNGYSSQILSSAEIGKKINRSFIILRYEGMQPLNNEILLSEINYLQTGLYTNQNAFQGFLLKYGYTVNKEAEANSPIIWLSFGGGMYGQDVLRNPSMNIGVSKVF